MSEPSAIPDTVLRKMLRAPPRRVGPVGTALERIADDLFRRSAKSVHNLDLLVTEISVDQITADIALKERPESCMTAVISGPDGRPALMIFDALLIDGLIEVQTVGRLLDLERIDRPVTDIDCAMAEPFLQDLLQRLGASSGETPDLAGLRSLNLQRVERDPVQLALDLTEKLYDRLQVSLDLGPGAKRGCVQLVLPTFDGGAAGEDRSVRRNPSAVDAIRAQKVSLPVSLPWITLSVPELRRLKVGDCLAVPRAHLAEVEVSGNRGVPIARGQLGQLDGYRAVRLGGTTKATQPVSGGFKEVSDVSAAPVPTAAIASPQGAAGSVSDPQSDSGSELVPASDPDPDEGQTIAETE